MKQSVKRKIVLTAKKNFIWVILLLCMIAFFAIMEDLLENEIWRFDNRAYEVISSLISNPVTSIFMVVTNLGRGDWHYQYHWSNANFYEK